MYTLPELPYEADALEPHFDAETMRLHHGKHHQAYVDKLNDALKEHPDLAEKPVEDLIADLNAVPEAVRTAVKNHGGGHANHSLFWTSLSPQPTAPSDDLKDALTETFGGLDHLREGMTAAALGQFGSGWAWLTLQDGALAVKALPNQDSPLSSGATPLLNVDVWEHAYYLKYQNRRADYLAAWWNLINWPEVERRWRS